ncbi:MAG: hypothetical protein ACW99Q_05480 [Candidatus Kariarchaeaceae archaeon]|jgi:hypothetical protein
MNRKRLISLIMISVLVFAMSSSNVSAALPDNLVVAFDHTHDAALQISARGGSAIQLQNNLTAAGSEWANITGTFAIPDDTNVLLFASPGDEYTAAQLTEIDDWFTADAPRLMWVSGDSDFDDPSFYPVWLSDAVNGILAKVGANLRLGAGVINDPIARDGSSYRPAANTPVTGGTMNTEMVKGVSSAIFHSPVYVLGYESNALVDLTKTDITGVEMVMRMNSSAVIGDQDLSDTAYDYYSQSGQDINGTYPVMAAQDMGDNHYIVVTGEPIFTTYKNMYDLETEKKGETGAWNGGVHDGKTLVDNVMTWFGGIVTANPVDTDDDGLPLPILPILVGIGLIPILRRRK